MRTRTINIIELVPDDGNWLTQVEIEDEFRIFVNSYYCPENQVDLWTEWTNEQKEQWEAEHPIETPEETLNEDNVEPVEPVE